MQLVDINWAAFAAAVVVKFILGAVWYSPPLFVRQWQAETGISSQDMGKRMPVALPVELVGAAITAFVLVHFIRYAGADSYIHGATVGFLSWLGFVATPSAGYVAFGSRKLKLTLIDNGYHLVGLVLMGAILGHFK
jgi:hypothetical protein